MKETGLIKKYIIKKADGSDTDPNAEYFILRLDAGQKDFAHRLACLKAILTYAEVIKDHLPLLAKDIIDRYGGCVEPIAYAMSQQTYRELVMKGMFISETNTFQMEVTFKFNDKPVLTQDKLAKGVIEPILTAEELIKRINQEEVEK